METETFELWVPRNSVAYKNYKHVSSNFISSDRGVVMLYQANDGGNVLREDVLLELLEINNNLTTVLVGDAEEADGGEADGGVGFQTFCSRAAAELPCQYSNVLGVFNYDENTLKGAAAANQLLPAIQALESVVPLATALGGVERDPDTNALLSAKIIRVVWPHARYNTTDPRYYVASTREETDIEDAVRVWELSVLEKYYWDYNDDDINPDRLSTIDLIVERSVDDEIGRLIAVDLQLFIMSIFAIVVILAISFAVPPKKICGNSRIAVGFASFFVVLLSVIFSFGFMGMAGISANSICFMLLFIVAGVGVDDCIVVENFYAHAIDQGKPIGGRMSVALERGGLSVFLTSASSILAFASGCLADMPGVYMFCACGALTFTWVFVLSVTFFPAMLVIDERRIARGRAECLCCIPGGTSKVDVQPDAEKQLAASGEEGDKIASTKIGEILTPVLTSPIGKLAIPVCFFALAALNVVMMLKNGTGLSVTDVVPDDSYIAKLVYTSDKYWFGNSFRGMQIIFSGDFYEDEEKVGDMYEYFEWLEGLDYIAGDVGMADGHWYEHYLEYLDSLGLDHYTDFNSNLTAFLTLRKEFRTEVTCKSGDFDDCSSGIAVAKFPVWQTSKIDTYELYLIEVELNDKLEELGFERAYAWLSEFGYADADATIEEATVVSLATCVAVVMGLMTLLMDTGSAVCIFVCVAFVDVDLLGMLYMWDVKLSSVSFSGLIMSIGLSIDYNIHIAHAFLDARGDVATRTKHALDLMGPSVLKGGLTTFIGTVVLSNASSTVFRIFFKLCFGTVLLGVAHGVVLMPILLGWYITVFPSKGGGH
jgi:Niemann-Pick C1 protein